MVGIIKRLYTNFLPFFPVWMVLAKSSLAIWARIWWMLRTSAGFVVFVVSWFFEILHIFIADLIINYHLKKTENYCLKSIFRVKQFFKENQNIRLSIYLNWWMTFWWKPLLILADWRFKAISLQIWTKNKSEA